MRYRLMATYLGVPYHAGLGPDGNEATLFSPGPPPDELGFIPAGGHWRKQVNVADLGTLWQSRVVGEYRGEPCLVLDDLGDRLHIAYQGRDSARARQLGYWEIDREVFEVVVARQDVTGLTEERVEYPLDAAMFPASNRDPVARARPEALGRGPGWPQAPGEAQAPGEPRAASERTSPLRAVPSGYMESAGYADPGPDRSSVPRTGWPPGTARPRPNPGRGRSLTRGPNPGPTRGRIPGATRGTPEIPVRTRGRVPGRGSRRHPPRLPPRPPRLADGAPGGATAYPSLSSPNSSAWPPSRTRLTRSTRRCRARCAWSRPMAASRCSAGPTTRGWTCASSKTRRRPTSTYSAFWRRRRCEAGGCGPARSTGTSTDRAGPECPRARLRKTFRSTYGARSYPNRHPVQLWLIQPAGLTVPRSPSSPVGLLYRRSQWGYEHRIKSHCHYLPDVKFLHFRPGGYSRAARAYCSVRGCSPNGR